jgi:opacity protein-like surface antigen
LSNSFESISDSSTGLSVGLGLEYAFADFLSVRADLDSLIGVEDFNKDEAITLFTVGAQFHF